MTRSEVANLFNAIPTLDIGDYVQVINPPSFLQSAPISQLCWGFTETLNAYVWTISINTVPESPYSEAPRNLVRGNDVNPEWVAALVALVVAMVGGIAWVLRWAWRILRRVVHFLDMDYSGREAGVTACPSGPHGTAAVGRGTHRQGGRGDDTERRRVDAR